jgi:hypothetical protein
VPPDPAAHLGIPVIAGAVARTCSQRRVSALTHLALIGAATALAEARPGA